MKALVKTVTVVTLDLTEDEAKWLMSTVQNPLGCEPEEEDPNSRGYREQLFLAIHDQFNP